MKRRLCISLLAMLTVGLASVPVRADAENTVRQQLTANYAKIVKGFKTGDPAAWEGSWFLTSS